MSHPPSHSPAPRAHAHPCEGCGVESSFCSFSSEVRAVFDGLKTTTMLEKGDGAFYDAAPCHSVFIVCSGRMKLVMSSMEGRSLLLRFAGPGQLLGLPEAMLPDTRYQSSAIATQPSVLAVIPRETFQRFIGSYKEACAHLTYTLSEEYRLAQREARFLALGDTSTARLAHLLLEQAAQSGVLMEDGIHIPLQVTHFELAQSIGSTRETITRILGHLHHRGVLERTSDGIIIHAPEELDRLVTY